MIYWIVGIYTFLVALSCIWIGYDGHELELNILAFPLVMIFIIPATACEEIGKKIKKLENERRRLKTDPKYKFDQDLSKLLK